MLVAVRVPATENAAPQDPSAEFEAEAVEVWVSQVLGVREETDTAAQVRQIFFR